MSVLSGCGGTQGLRVNAGTHRVPLGTTAILLRYRPRATESARACDGPDAVVRGRGGAHDPGMVRVGVVARLASLLILASTTSAWGSGLATSVVVPDDSTYLARYRHVRPPYSRGLRWPDRPLQGIGTHVPGRGEFEIESEAISYAVTTRTEVFGFGKVRYRREVTRAAVQQWSFGVANRVAVALASDGYDSDLYSISGPLFYSSTTRWHILNTVRIKIRPWGSDSSAWSHAFAVEGAIRDEYGTVGYSFSQVFPLGRGTRGRASLGVRGTRYIGKYSYPASTGYYLGAPHKRPAFDSEPYDVSIAIEQRLTPSLWTFAECSMARDRLSPAVNTGLASFGAAHTLGVHVMLDAGARFATTRQSPDVQGFLGLSLR